ncbi:DUF2484 family protein [Paracoccus sp. CPCC 101403]|uniref:DUF2484 family protein n=2 Tax=Paracoccus broussonetiae TaxID=3075834 RepID=A0ABU3EBF0_9RHOB|nr:DUF2484 family protein [Paracoccus sp. CPCC 101403]MDT1061558.1 DUF2484 family protein [Paracoccus sp. CPCC 101403]
MSELASHPATAAICALSWAFLSCMLPFLRPGPRHVALWALVLAGVPVLGWLTFLYGPGFGVLFMALGLSILVWPPVEWMRRRQGTS